jgi:uncharacterized Ntn-hydrolase superfamily protein
MTTGGEHPGAIEKHTIYQIPVTERHGRARDLFTIWFASSSPAVAARCAYARAGVGAVTTQNITDPRLGPRALDLLASGLRATDACAALQGQATHPQYRQLTLADKHGGTAHFSGAKALGVFNEAAGPIKSTGLILVDKAEWPIADLRIDWQDEPITALSALWDIWKPQMHNYITHAFTPAAAPSYGVPGDE